MVMHIYIKIHSYSLYLGDLEDLELEKTTLANIDPMKHPYSQYVWVHVVAAFVFFPVSILVMKRFSIGLAFTEDEMEIKRTLMISKIPRKVCHQKDDLMAYFKVHSLHS